VRVTSHRDNTPRVPRVAKQPEVEAGPEAPEEAAPPVTSIGPWTPCTDEARLASLENVAAWDGGHAADPEMLLVSRRARYLRSPEPRLDAGIWNARCTFGKFPELHHKAGQWWQLENKADVFENLNKNIGYAVDIIVHVFSKQPTMPK